jgi:hypothetical protein
VGFLNYNILFLLIFSAVLRDFDQYWGSRTFFEAISLGEVGRLLPTSNIYKPEVLEAIGEVQNRKMLKIC